MPATGILRITDTLQYIPKEFASPNTTTPYYLQQAIGDIIAIIKYPLKTLILLSYSDATKNASNHIAHIFHRSTAQPRLQILPFPPIIPQSQNKNILLPKIISPPAPSPRV